MKQSHLDAMRRGRERATERRQNESVERVLLYRKWLRADVDHTRKLELHRAGVGRHPGKRPTPPIIPSDYDYAVARERGAI